MAKNNRLIKQCKLMYQQIQEITPNVYAGIALALHRRYGWENEAISDLFAESQEIWQECVDAGVDMVPMCEEETGIEVQRRVGESNG